MHSNDKDSIRVEPSSILLKLAQENIKFILVGGLAAVVQGAPITTMDIDILYDRSPENVSKLISFLKSIDAIYRRPDDKKIEPKEDDLLKLGHRLFTTRLGPIDVLAFIEKDKNYRDIIEHTVEIEFRGHKIYVLELEMMIDLKRDSKHQRDIQRIPILKETLRQLKKNQLD